MRKVILVLVTVAMLAVLPLTVLADSVQGSGWIIAEGSGTAFMKGSGWARISGDGTLLIQDRGGDAEISISGEGTRRDGPDGSIIYEGFNGSAYIKGSAITIGLRGDDIRLEAEGRGLVVLKGDGWYRAGSGETEIEGRWTATGVRLQLQAAPGG